MNIKPFAVEEWMNEYEVGALYNIAETCVDSVSLDELFELTGENKEDFLKDFCAQRLTYGNIWGSEALRSGISKLYHTIKADEVVLTHGAAGANHHVFCSLISAGDRVVSIMPTYQQLYSIPEAIGADVAIMHLKQENDYLPDLNELKSLVTPETKMICINNPNNPTGALMSKELLGSIVEIARGVGAYILCDEVYRHLTQEDEWCESIVDLYEKGISVSSMSKVFSLAGLRMGWIATHDEAARKAFLSHRDYNLISCGMFDDAIASIALRHSDVMLRRNQRIVRENLAILDDWIKEKSALFLHQAQSRYDRARLLRFRYPLLRVLQAHVPRDRCVRHAGRLLRAAPQHARRLRLRRQHAQRRPCRGDEVCRDAVSGENTR